MEVTKIIFKEETEEPPVRSIHKPLKKKLTKQKSEKDTTREASWERRKRQVSRKEKSSLLSSSAGVDVPCGGGESNCLGRLRSVSKADVDDLRGCIELGFGFEEEYGGHELCNTLPALDLYFAINRSSKKLNFVSSPDSTPTRARSSSSVFSLSPSVSFSSSTTGTISPTPSSPRSYDSWKLLQPGDTPEHIKTKLMHWAKVVACTAEQYIYN
ncbi:hypothetical protein ZOSMA_114G00840 [Zostera marina]|uniref:Uncharacterized protein n=1 Tax=Zostera marina TaxID=29655 RepID=A0A0K9Q4N5_ZOSMR|nr:hypothetical protein ZOSMA_114G00840 [Zostera marina]